MKLSAAITLLLLLPAASFAARENKLESWYTYWGWGYGENYYRKWTQNSKGGLVTDLLGFYLPWGHKTLMGGILNVSANSWYSSSYGPPIRRGITRFLAGSSLIYFPQHEIGQGMFLRVDAGLAWHRSWHAYGDNDYSAVGKGFLLGTGYGYPMTPGARLLLNVNFARRIIEGRSVNSIALTLNGLF